MIKNSVLNYYPEENMKKSSGSLFLNRKNRKIVKPILAFFVLLMLIYWTRVERNTSQTTVSTGENPFIRGRCGAGFLTPTGAVPACDKRISTCCSPRGWCSNSPEDCLCDECEYYEWDAVSPFMPENGVQEDDNSVFELQGYKNIIISPQADCNANTLIVVYSAMANFAYRQLVRLTWGNRKYLKQMNATLIFALGRFPNLKLQWRVEREAERYKDILQGDFFEDYFLLAYKSLTWMDWSREHCSKVPWIVKTDDDMVNNIWRLGAYINSLPKEMDAISCSTKTEKVIRQKVGGRQDKWVIPFDEWPEEYFPTNCWGVVYIFNFQVRNRLLKVFESSNKAIFRVDDVFITGILADKANITHRDISDWISKYEEWDEEEILTGNVWFGHIPPDLENLHKKRYWLWRRLVEHEFLENWESVSEIDTSYL